MLEYEEKLSEFYSPEYASLIIQVLANLPNLLPVNPIAFNWRLISVDPDGNKIVDAYVAAGADFILSDDRHFNPDYALGLRYESLDSNKSATYVREA